MAPEQKELPKEAGVEEMPHHAPSTVFGNLASCGCVKSQNINLFQLICLPCRQPQVVPMQMKLTQVALYNPPLKAQNARLPLQISEYVGSLQQLRGECGALELLLWVANA